MNSRLGIGRFLGGPFRPLGRIARCSLLFAAMAATAGVQAQVNQWLQDQSGLWEVPSNWSLGLPQPNHDVVISFSGITVTHGTGSDAIRTLQSNGNLAMTGGQLAILFTGVASQIAGNLLMQGGAIGGPADLILSGQTQWASGAMFGTGSTVAQGAVTFSGSSYQLQSGRHFVQRAQAQWNSGTFQLDPTSEYEVDSAAQLQINGADPFSGGTLRSRGTILKSSGGTTTLFTNFVQDSGQIVVSGGVLAFSGTSSFLATTTATNGMVRFLSGTHAYEAGSSFSGNLGILGGLVDLKSGATVIADTTISGGRCRFQSGAIFGSGSLALGPGGELEIASGTLQQTGPFANFDLPNKTLQDGTYIVRPNAIFQFPGADIERNNARIVLSGSAFRGSGQIQDENGDDALDGLSENNGEIEVTDDGEVHTEDSLGNNGTMKASGGGTFSVDGSMGNNGTMDIAEGGTTEVGAVFRAGGVYNQSSGITIVDGILRALVGVVIETGILAGNGTIEANVRTNGILQPGRGGVGNLTVTKSLQFIRSSSVHVELGGKSPGQFDHITVGGSALVRGKVEIFAVNGFQPQVGDEFRILDSTGFTLGNFTQVVSHIPNVNFTSSRDAHGITLKVIP